VSDATTSGGSGERTPEQIQREIEATRENLGDTAAALAQKADVKGQAKAKVDEVKETVRQRTGEFAGKAREATPESASAGAGQVATSAQENPIPFAVGGALAAGLLVGWLLGRH